jgi:hypothetical protein
MIWHFCDEMTFPQNRFSPTENADAASVRRIGSEDGQACRPRLTSAEMFTPPKTWRAKLHLLLANTMSLTSIVITV